ncbi:LysR family transcriptional regulator [Xenophilus azovorans]|uniref:LysR family transcriptional regulator n=1 Tax=Xenophilus azovorans TaxID=151755 RepID=UPI000690C2D7|nr:LysR family transcriptional regulator [Xenophilus azovorans]
MNITQRQLRLFTVVAALQNMSRAARTMHLSQPALTRALQEFESQLGAPLFHRTTRRVALTPAGESLLPTAQRLLHDLDLVGEAMAHRVAGAQGVVSIAVGTAFGCTVLAPALKRFAATHPGVQVRVIDANSAAITRRVVDAEVDLGIGTPVGDVRLLACHRMLQASLGVLAHAAAYRLPRALTAERAAELPLLKESDDTSIMQALRVHGSPLVAHMAGGTEVNSLALQLSLAQAGVGVAVLSALGASHAMAQGLRFVPLRPVVRREVFLMHRRDRLPAPAAEALLGAVAHALRAAPLHRGVVVDPAFKWRPDRASR